MIISRGVELALKALAQPNGRIRAALLEGPPGCGKTSLASHAAQVWGAELVYSMLHAWTDDQELFVGVDVASVIANEPENVRQPGILARAAKASLEGLVVLTLDEIDKSPERVEMLLLDFLQTGRVPVRPGEHIQADVDRLVVFLTTNGMRPLSDALLRRCRRVRMSPLPVTAMIEIIAASTGLPKGAVRLGVKLCREVADAEGNPALSIQEIEAFIRDAATVAENAEDVRFLLAQWAAREENGEAYAQRANVGAFWAEVKRR